MALNHYIVGGKVVMLGTCANVDPITEVETANNPTSLIFYRRKFDTTLVSYTWPSPASPEISHLGDGVFACIVDIDDAGRERWRFETHGAVKAVAEDEFDVKASKVL